MNVNGLVENFPIFLVQKLDDFHILLAGGGGSFKSGIPNLIKIYRIRSKNCTQKLLQCTSSEIGFTEVYNNDMKEDLPFKLDYHQRSGYAVFTSLKKMFLFRFKIEDNPIFMLMETKTNSPSDDKQTFAELTYEFLKFLPQMDDKSQPDIIVASNNHLFRFNIPNFHMEKQITHHQDKQFPEIGDMKISPVGNYIVCCFLGNLCHVRSPSSLELIASLRFNPLQDSEATFRFGNCTFSSDLNVAEHESIHSIFFSHSPANVWRGKTSKASYNDAYISKWTVDGWLPTLSTSLGLQGDRVTTMKASPCNLWLVAGTLKGRIMLFDQLTMQYTTIISNFHVIGVTDFEFLHSGRREIPSKLFSVSGDRQCLVHDLPVKGSFTPM